MTQLYFSEDEEANEKDELQRLLTAEQRRQLRVTLNSSGEGVFNIALSRLGYPGVGKNVRPWDMGINVETKYREGTTAKL